MRDIFRTRLSELAGCTESRFCPSGAGLSENIMIEKKKKEAAV